MGSSGDLHLSSRRRGKLCCRGPMYLRLGAGTGDARCSAVSDPGAGWRIGRISDCAHLLILKVRWRLSQERSHGIRPQWKPEGRVTEHSVLDTEFSEPFCSH